MTEQVLLAKLTRREFREHWRVENFKTQLFRWEVTEHI